MQLYGTHLNFRHIAPTLILWNPSLRISSQKTVSGLGYKQLRSKNCSKIMLSHFLLTCIHLVSGLHSGPDTSGFHLGAQSTLGQAQGGHLLNFEDPFQVFLSEGRSITELADFNPVTVCKTDYWETVMD